MRDQIAAVDKRYFIGLASPSAAAIIAGIVWLGHQGEVTLPVAFAAALITTVTGLLMVSNIRYNSFKDLDFRGRVPFVVMLLIVFIFVVITLHPPLVLLFAFLLYGLSGPALWLWSRRASVRKRFARSKPSAKESPEE
jgi:CDP-diacylglycerol--serine O-phosphatidyltransferase